MLSSPTPLTFDLLPGPFHGAQIGDKPIIPTISHPAGLPPQLPSIPHLIHETVPQYLHFPPLKTIQPNPIPSSNGTGLTFNPPHSGEKITSHTYGDFPTLKGALNFTRDSRIKEAEPILKDLLKQEELLTPRKGEFFIRLLSPCLLLVAILAAFYAVYIAVKSAALYGMQTKTTEDIGVNNTILDPAKYIYTASTVPGYQVFALRGGYNGQYLNMTLKVPNAAEMVDGAVIVVRNCSITFNNNADNKHYDSPKPAHLIIPELNYTEILNKRKSRTIISLTDANGVARWYDPILGNE